MRNKITQLLPLLLLCTVAFVSCEDEVKSTTTPSMGVAVSEFKLNKNDSILVGLNNTFFSIDLINGVIYNADSLPLGTDITELEATISFTNAPSEAEVYIAFRDTTKTKNYSFNYFENPYDSINFAADTVLLKVVAADGTTKMDYKLKINVHTVIPDRLSWSELSVSDGVSGENNLEAMKVVLFNEEVYGFMVSPSGFVLKTTPAIEQGWSTQTLIALPAGATPNLNSLQVGESMLYLLDTVGYLYTSTDGVAWTATNQQLYSTIGVYPAVGENPEMVLAIEKTANGYLRTSYPASTATPAPSDFPVEGFSNPVLYTPTAYTQQVQLMVLGGKMANGSLNNGVWGYDGVKWSPTPLNNAQNSVIQPCEGAQLVGYQSFPRGSSFNFYKPYDTWMAWGGFTPEGEISTAMYTSFDNGVTWAVADSLLTLPAEIAPRAFASPLVVEQPVITVRSASTSWRSIAAPYMKHTSLVRSDSFDTVGDVPYIYLYGGVNVAGEVFDQVWRGVIDELTFDPIP